MKSDYWIVEKFLERYFGKRGTRIIVSVILIVFGVTHPEIQKKYGTALSTLGRYRQALESGNIEKLFIVSDREWKRSELDNYEKEILGDFEKNPPRTLREAQSRIEILTGIKRSLNRINVWLLKRGFVPGQ
jgi:transposase